MNYFILIETHYWSLDLEEETVLSFLKEWDIKKKIELFPSHKRYIKKVNNENSIIVNKYTDTEFDNPNIFIDYNPLDNIFKLQVRLKNRAYFSLLFAPFLIYFIVTNFNLINICILIIVLLIYYLFIKWILVSELNNIKKELENLFVVNNIKFS